MATALLTPNTTAAQSASFALTTDQNTTLTPVPAMGAIASMAATAWAYIEKQEADASWQVIGGALTVPGEPKVLSAAGTYRINRPLQANAIGVDRD